MKKNKLMIAFLILVIFSLTGCGAKNLEGVDGKPVKNEETGQILPSNMLCAPQDEERRKLYKQTKRNYLILY